LINLAACTKIKHAMMQVNFPVILFSALIPVLVGALWYHPALLGKMWMRESGMRPELLTKGNKVLIFGMSFLFSFLLAFSLQFMVIHQWHLYSLIANEAQLEGAGGDATRWLEDAMKLYGENFRTFKHGAFHGVLVGLLTATPFVGVLALLERKSFKYIFIHSLYWTICTALMGGIICAFS
jgi:hypothetical protein